MTESPSVDYTGAAVLEAMTHAKNYNAALVDLIVSEEPDHGARLLDFGAGYGTYADMLRSRGYDPDCLEVDSGLFHALSAKGHRVTNEIGSLDQDSFDLIYALNVMEHIENDVETVQQLAGALAPGGRLLIYVPAFQILYSPFDRLVGHYRRYTRSSLEKLAASAGLTVKELRYCDPLGWPAAMAYKFAGSKDGDLSPRSVATYDRWFFPLSRRLERVFGQAFGKNVLLIAERPPR